eukprot:4219394-Amphidinium_carterae.1
MATYRTGCKIPPVDDIECREWSRRFIDLVLRGAPLPKFIFSTVTELDDDGKVMSKVNRDVKPDLPEVRFGQVQEEDMEMQRPSKSRKVDSSARDNATQQPLVPLCPVCTCGLLHGERQCQVHMQMAESHRTIERMGLRIRTHLSEWVLDVQAKINYTRKEENARRYEIEVDEVTLAKFPSGVASLPVMWVSYLGIVRRGDPTSLKLVRLPLRNTKARAPGTGPITSRIWAPHAQELVGSDTVMHTDSARAYKRPIAGVLHTSVVHQLKKVDGIWVRPVFSQKKTVAGPNGDVLEVRTGTQTIDGFWSHLREACRYSKRSVESIDAAVRQAQFNYWSQGKDRVAFYNPG